MSMTQTEQEIKKLNTLNDNYTALVDIFDHLVPREYVVLTLSAPSDVDWTMYSVIVTNNDKGTSDTYAIPSNGVVEFEVKYDTTYTIKLPVLGDFVTPKDLTFTAGMKMREVWYSYRMVGLFGIDTNGKFYTIEQIESLDDKSIIKYGGYTDGYLENYQKADGTFGCGFMWELQQESVQKKWSDSNLLVDTTLSPLTDRENAKDYYDGEAYTRYSVEAGLIAGVFTPALTECINSSIVINGIIYRGYMPAYGQFWKLISNKTRYLSLYSALGIDYINIFQGIWFSCNQRDEAFASTIDNSLWDYNRKTTAYNTIIFYPLP